VNVLQAFADVLEVSVPRVLDANAPTERRRAYQLTEKALHVWGPAACRKAGREDLALMLEATGLDDGLPGPDGTRPEPNSAHRSAWPALGRAEYRIGTGAWAVTGEPTTPSGKTDSASETDRWTLWARRAATWALRADMQGDATTYLRKLAG
jgi:hypothetical protein